MIDTKFRHQHLDRLNDVLDLLPEWIDANFIDQLKAKGPTDVFEIVFDVNTDFMTGRIRTADQPSAQQMGAALVSEFIDQESTAPTIQIFGAHITDIPSKAGRGFAN